MRHGTVAFIAAGGIASAMFGANVADAAPTAPDAAEVVDRLEAHGFHVFVHGGDGPLDRCAVNAVRPGQTFEWMGLDVPGPRDGLGKSTTIVTGMTIHLDVTC